MARLTMILSLVTLRTLLKPNWNLERRKKAVECKERGKECQSDRLTRSDSGIEVTLGLPL